MKKYFIFGVFLILILANSLLAIGQDSCTYTNSLVINTGDNTALVVGDEDINWIISDMTSLIANVPGAPNIGDHPFVISSSSTWANSNDSKWLSFITNNSYSTNINAPVDGYMFEILREFKVCSKDSFNFNFQIANDNYCTISIDGIDVYTQLPSINSGNYNSFTQIPQFGMMLQEGVHEVKIKVYNYPAIGVNPHGVNFKGLIESINGTNSLILNGDLEKCDCSVIECSDLCYWKLNGNVINNNSNKFGTLTNHDIDIVTNSTSRGVFKNSGELGWNVQNPSALLHINCYNSNLNYPSNIRFENLQENLEGSILIIRKDGYVFDSKINLRRLIDKFSDINEENKYLIDKIKELDSRIDKLERLYSQNDLNNDRVNYNSPILYQNYPNPYNNETNIKISIPKGFKKANVLFFNSEGVVLKKYPIYSEKDFEIIISNRDIKELGIIYYSLIIDDIVFDTKTMIRHH